MVAFVFKLFFLIIFCIGQGIASDLSPFRIENDSIHPSTVFKTRHEYFFHVSKENAEEFPIDMEALKEVAIKDFQKTLKEGSLSKLPETSELFEFGIVEKKTREKTVTFSTKPLDSSYFEE